MMEKMTDAELMDAGRRAAGLNQCGSVIVATDADGVRNYHNCDQGRVHANGDNHSCGCGQTWQMYGARETRGPLTAVVDGNGHLNVVLVAEIDRGEPPTFPPDNSADHVR